jgi:hypothetical protein
MCWFVTHTQYKHNFILDERSAQQKLCFYEKSSQVRKIILVWWQRLLETRQSGAKISRSIPSWFAISIACIIATISECRESTTDGTAPAAAITISPSPSLATMSQAAPLSLRYKGSVDVKLNPVNRLLPTLNVCVVWSWVHLQKLLPLTYMPAQSKLQFLNCVAHHGLLYFFPSTSTKGKQCTSFSPHIASWKFPPKGPGLSCNPTVHI